MKSKILIVEDESIEAMNFEQYLKSFGYDVVGIASTGEGAVEKVIEFEPDLVLMDIILKGDMDGIEAAAQIKEDFDIPVVYLTAHPEESAVNRAKLTSPYGYIIKPVNKTDLKNIIELALYKHQMENKLKKSEEKYRRIIENVLDAYFRANKEGKIISASPSAAQMYRYDSPQDMIGVSALSLYKSPGYKQQETIAELQKHGKARNIEDIALRKDGTTFWVSTNIQFYYNEQGEIEGVDSFVRDINKQKEAEVTSEYSKKHLENIFKNAPIGIFHSSPEGKFYDVNKTLSDMLGYESPEEFISVVNKTSIKEKLYVDKEKHSQFINEVIKDGQWHSFENRYYRKDGNIITAELSFRSVLNPNGSVKYLEGFIKDITERLKANKILLIKNELAFALSESSDLIETLNLCLDAAIKISRMDSGGIYLVNDSSGELELKVHSGLSYDFVASSSHYKTDSPNAQIVMEGHPIYTHYKKLGIPISKTDLKENIRGIAIIPVKHQGKVIANLNIASHNIDEFPDQSKKALETIAGQIGGSIIRSKAEKALFDSEKRYRELVDYSLVAVYETNLKGEILFANNAMAKMFEYESVEDLKTNNIIKLYKNAADRDKFTRELKKSRSLSQYEIKAVSKSGKTCNVIVNALLSNNNISGMIMDITERKKAEDALRASEEKYRTLFESNPDYTILLGLDGVILDINAAAEDVIGVPKDEIVGKHFTQLDIFAGDELSRHGEMFSRLLKGENVTPYESRIYDKKGKIHWIETLLTTIKKGGKPVYILIINSDINKWKKAEDEIKASLKEKEILLKEIHHRVKNNLQIISSLLDLQETYVKEDLTAVNVLRESKNRVLSMAMIHEMLYQSKDLNHINFSDYIRNLVSNLFHSYSVKSTITPVINVEQIYLNIETSIPCGLIISELVSNSLKYAFPNDKAGELQISLESLDKEYRLVISDNGIGFPEELDFKNVESSLGLRLVNSLVNQLDGSIELDRSYGTKFTIKFHELEYEDRI